jgi:hypothetical protein
MAVIAKERLVSLDPVWTALRSEAEGIAATEPDLASFVHASILGHARLEEALSFHLANKLGNADTGAMKIRDTFLQAFAASPQIGEAVRADLAAIRERDPASRIGCGITGAPGWPCISRAAFPRPSALTSIRPPASVAASSSTTPPAW